MPSGRPKTVSSGVQQKMAPKEGKNNKENKEVLYMLEKNDKRNEERWTELITEIRLMKEKHEQEREAWKKERDEGKKEREELSKRIKKLEMKKEKKEREEKRKNIVIKGVNFENNDLKENINKFINDKLKVEVKSKKAIIVKTKGNRRITVAEVESVEKKKEIMINKRRLGAEKVYIDDDLTFKERKIQSKIRELAKKKKQEVKLK